METRRMRSQNDNRWVSFVPLLVGLWLMFAPTVLEYSTLGTGADLASNNDFFVGAAVTILAAISLFFGRNVGRWLPWVIAIIGVYEIAAPFVLGYAQLNTPLWNAIISGALIVVGSASRAMADMSSYMMRDSSRNEFGPTYTSEVERRKMNEKQED